MVTCLSSARGWNSSTASPTSSTRSNSFQLEFGGAGFRLGDIQSGIDHFQQSVAFLGGGRHHRLGFHLRSVAGQNHLGRGANPAERASQVVGQIVGHLPHPDDQRVNPIQHEVEGSRQGVQLVALRLHRNAPVQLALGDFGRRPRDFLNAAQGASRHEPADRPPDHDDDREDDEKSLEHRCHEILVVSQGFADLEHHARRDGAQDRPHRVFALRQHERFQDRRTGVGKPCRQVFRVAQSLPLREVRSHDLPAIGSPQAKERPMRLVAFGVHAHLRHDAVETAQAHERGILMDVVLQILVGTLAHDPRYQDVSQREGERGRHREDARVPQRQAQRQRVAQVKERL